ncbi:salivary glue protein Sgs-3-like [Bradysia coprophila]|uniref:salivary glue protein Sgs-3-like n=1 Tax=Bradysia coprophila TaxID=38358 RepID=UPI00187D765E|nr:salivary glue protein Sgs-3-like [Bradysia coprophila]
MMDQIMMALVLISIFSIANGQLSCYVCTDCPYIDADMVSQPCDFVSPPDTTTTTTLSTTTPPPETTVMPPETTNLPPDTTTLTPDTSPSTPNTPPTATTTSIIPPTISNSSSQNDLLINESIIEVTTDKSTDLSDENSDRTQISLGPPYRKLIHQTTGSQHHCFRIGRTVGDRTEVVRGCVVPANTIHETCVRANNGITPISCRICQNNECNATSRNTSISVVLLLTTIVSIRFLR